jgi:hypothetical protein
VIESPMILFALILDQENLDMLLQQLQTLTVDSLIDQQPSVLLGTLNCTLTCKTSLSCPPMVWETADTDKNEIINRVSFSPDVGSVWCMYYYCGGSQILFNNDAQERSMNSSYSSEVTLTINQEIKYRRHA